MPSRLDELEPSHVDPSLAAEGAERIAWARSNMPVLAEPGYQPVPPEIDRAVARAALRTLSTIELG